MANRYHVMMDEQQREIIERALTRLVQSQDRMLATTKDDRDYASETKLVLDMWKDLLPGVAIINDLNA